METVSKNLCFGGVQSICQHQSETVGTAMRFSVYSPPQAKKSSVPVLWWLSGLTCTEENFTFKAGAQRYAAEHGLLLVAPDTSPRGADIDGENDAYDFGTGAGFYVDATVPPWDKNYRMFSYVSNELPQVVSNHFPANIEQQGISGHSMGGHGALIIALKNPGQYRSVSAFSPICNPTECAWGKKALSGYLGKDSAAWRQWDATTLIEDGYRCPAPLIDQGTADEFLHNGQLRPDALQSACNKHGQPLDLRTQPGCDHSYYFIASFIGEHIAHHAAALRS
ncbi:S-formylglutathione hydrolase [Candidatus Persebacteraceae bacterium Df01]|jgi:S-formylglutathione hydrolase|uniref:S-formylglutathione hydrolase n=1 Tax=Candidatus Doriopsillibacter californiensis TaxID=2970740 RepID=A0ABT7QK13_9GAMM|nr:S-formylglutathione hydrolase [Candidatus Persebacteraceae bacterium Df01]